MLWIGDGFGQAPRPPALRSVLLLIGGGFMALSSWTYSPAGYVAQTGDRTLGPVPALIALAGLIERRQRTAVWVVAGAVTVVTGWLTAWDAVAQPRGASALKSILSVQGASIHTNVDLEPAAPVVVAAVGVVLAVGSGVLLRSRRDAAAARGEAAEERRAADQLGDELARRLERERIAREVHDAMGHRLSLLNLHAGALELRADGDGELADSARIVSDSARAAHADLRSLLSALREPLAAEPANFSLVHLQDVVNDSLGAGEHLSSSIFIESADSADPTLARAVYRIVQELLTNARQHAPRQPVRLTVAGGPATGIHIDATNRLAVPVVAMSRESRGLAGITERAELLGGEVRYGMDGGETAFRVTVDLPWRRP